MGWKSVKDHYQVGHIVQVSEGCICIGSSYIHDLITINPNMRTIVNPSCGIRGNADLERYWAEIHADLDQFWRLVDQSDTFAVSIPVYMFNYEALDVVELLCEQPGWPHVTHCGRIMHENDYFLTRAEAVIDAAKQLESSLTYMEDDLKRRSKELADFASRIDQKRGAMIRLKEEATGVSRETIGETDG